MFSDSECNASGFHSNWKCIRSCESNSSQTTEIVKCQKDVQTLTILSVEAQTEDVELQPTVTYDEKKLAAFLQKVYPELVKHLDDVSDSDSFATYTLAADTEDEIRVVTTISPHGVEDASVSDLSWSCTGSVLAVALSQTLHSSWCSHQGHIMLYNVDRETETPVCTLEAPSCIRSVCMHPHLSSIVAAGTFSGEVLVWDISLDNSEALLVNKTHTSHDDSITQVRWVGGPGSATLVSSALDGHLIFWKVSPHISSYQMNERFSCGSQSRQPGVMCFAFPRNKQDTFVAVLEGGLLLHCLTTAAKPISSVIDSPAEHSSETIKNPVISRFEPQSAAVTCVEFSPHDDDVFATVSTDHTVKIYSLLQEAAQFVINGAEGLFGLRWLLSQANVFAAWGNGSAFVFYNSSNGDQLASFPPSSDAVHKTIFSAAAFNVKSPSLMAVGDLNGVVHVWKIPSQLSDNLNK